MPTWLWVAVGSAAGGVARYAIGRIWPTVPGSWPLATMLVNVVGSLAIGLLSVWLADRSLEARLFWMTGVLGGFTTYSAFALETVTLAEGGMLLRSAAYVAMTVMCCIIAAMVGRALATA